MFAGERHTVITTEENVILSAGWNKYCQLGSNNLKIENYDYFHVVDNVILAKNSRIVCGDWCTIHIFNKIKKIK